ncbi:MAG: prepilin peptidase [Ramlibacter sp.]|jgi:leader peptidase (prepilin peptidase)/N-methyltransferase|nr:prepilin peptidase [Ramlibacter sp.]
MGSGLWESALAGGVLGLLVGSFLNVVISRLPRMMDREWLTEVAGTLESDERGGNGPWSQVFGHKLAVPPVLGQASTVLQKALEALPPLGLARPGSHCTHCGHRIRWYENIPVFSYLVLRGKCSACGHSFGVRYLLVELFTGGIFALCAYRWGLTPLALAWAVFAAILVCQFLIDLDTQLLPDSLNYPLLWLGLLVAMAGWTIPLKSAVLGAALGYLILWGFFHAYRLATGKEGMGYGDFKLMAALGAWLGADYLLALILLSSLVGSVLGVALLVAGRIAHKDIPISFGPFIAGAGLLCLILGPAEVRNLIPFAFPLR